MFVKPTIKIDVAFIKKSGIGFQMLILTYYSPKSVQFDYNFLISESCFSLS